MEEIVVKGPALVAARCTAYPWAVFPDGAVQFKSHLAYACHSLQSSGRSRDGRRRIRGSRSVLRKGQRTIPKMIGAPMLGPHQLRHGLNTR